MRIMLQLSEQATQGSWVFLLLWGVGALEMGSVFASKKASVWIRELIVSGLEAGPVQQTRAKNSGGGRVIATVVAIAGLIGIGAGTVLLARG